MSMFNKIDISPLFGNDMKAKMNVARQIHISCRDTGFFFITNHSIDCLEELFQRTHHFHQTITDAEKLKMAIKAYNSDSENVLAGFYMSIKGKKAVESLYVQNPSFNEDHPLIKKKTPLHEITKWPDESKYPGYKEFLVKYYWKMFHLCKTLLRGFALALGKNEDFFDQYYNASDTLSSLRLIRYPYIEDYPPRIIASDGTELSFNWHRDVSLLTVLYQPFVANLQVETPNGYIDIESSDTDYLVNCGLYMEIITNGYFKAQIHRVKFVNKERLSIPFFVHLANDSVVETFNPLKEKENKECFDISYGEFFQGERVKLIQKNGQT